MILPKTAERGNLDSPRSLWGPAWLGVDLMGFGGSWGRRETQVETESKKHYLKVRASESGG